MQPDLDIQLADRVRTFLQRTGLTQRELAKAIHCDPGNFNAFLSGAKTLSVAKTAKLWRLMRLNRTELVEKFSASKSDARVEHLQIAGLHMALDDNRITDPRSGWVAGRSGMDPDGSTDITGGNANPARTVPDDDELEFLAGLAGLHQSIIDKINGYQIAKAVPNKNGVTSGPKSVATNKISKTPGIRGDMLSSREKTPAELQEHLEWLKSKNQEEQLKSRLQAEIAAESKAYWMELSKRHK